MKKTTFILFMFLMTALLISSVWADDFKPYETPCKGKKIAVLFDNQYQVGEAFYAPLRFREAGAEVTIVSHDVPVASRFRPAYTHYMKTDITPEEALKTRWDGVMVVGGFCPMYMREDKDVIKIITDCNKRRGMVSAVCHGVTALVTADIIRGKHVTGNVPREIEFTNAGAIFHDKAPWVDGNIITAISPGDNGPYLDAMVNWFKGGESMAKAHDADQYLKGKRIAMVIENRYEYSQVAYPSIRLRHNGAEVVMVANRKGEFSEYRNVLGKTKSDMTADEAMNEEFDAIILIGHYAADTYRRHDNIREFITKNLREGTLIASMNWGHTALIQANLCKGYEFAVTWGMQNDIKNAGGKALLQQVHRDRNLITCASDDDIGLLMRYLVGYLLTVK